MLVFDFECSLCHYIGEYLIGSNEDAPVCPKCSVEMVKQFSKLNYGGERQYSSVNFSDGTRVNTSTRMKNRKG